MAILKTSTRAQGICRSVIHAHLEPSDRVLELVHSALNRESKLEQSHHEPLHENAERGDLAGHEPALRTSRMIFWW